jgi:hypothetical protein
MLDLVSKFSTWRGELRSTYGYVDNLIINQGKREKGYNTSLAGWKSPAWRLSININPKKKDPTVSPL